MVGNLDVTWIHGSPNCAGDPGPSLQVHQFDPDTFIIRQSKCLNFEAPFLYLLIGASSAFLLDTGAQPLPGHSWPIRETVADLLSGRSVSLVVGHSHSHADHVAGDSQFHGQPGATVVSTGSVADIAHFYGISDWPNGQGILELGGRTLTVIPIPGHEPHHIAVYDQRSGIFLTGDMLYAGLLTVPVSQWSAFSSSAQRLASFATAHPVSHVLGAHVEMRNIPGKAFPLGTTFQPGEHPLPLRRAAIDELYQVCQDLAGSPSEVVKADFILSPLSG